MEEKVLELRRVVADLRGLNAKLEASERDLTHRLNHDMDALHRENLDLNTLKTKLTTTITEKKHMQRTLTSHEHNTTANINRSLAQKDGVIHKLTTTIKDLTNTIETMKIERQKTVEAHQSRIKHLQDHFAEQLKTAGKRSGIRLLFFFADAVRETVKTMKALFQKVKPCNITCEERMGLLALVDGLRRGVAGGGGDGAKHEKSVEKEEGSLYQSLASVAAGKKEGKLRMRL
ncbi:hypothetical protein BC829DRAFT_385330 [Chytridium lagenaria]|nr:hypothetical protein BC829DRAFT_385330 [Chytridium lagenaria]